MNDLESVKERMRLAAGALRTADLLRDALAVIEAQAQEIARLKAELELARGFMPKGTTLAPPSHEPWRKG